MEDDKFANQVEDLIIFRTTYKPDKKDMPDLVAGKSNNYTTIKNYLNSQNTAY